MNYIMQPHKTKCSVSQHVLSKDDVHGLSEWLENVNSHKFDCPALTLVPLAHMLHFVEEVDIQPKQNKIHAEASIQDNIFNAICLVF